MDIPKRWLGPPQAPVSVLTPPGALGMVDNSRTGWERVVHDDSPHNGCRCDFYLVGLIVAQADRQGTLRVRIYQEDTPTLTGKSNSQIYRRHGLSHAASLIAYGINRCAHHATAFRYNNR